MASYLLKWDPNKWDWRNIKELSEAVKGGVPVTKPWVCGTARRIAAGDRVFLIRLGREPRGIVGSGHVTRGSYEANNLEAQDTGQAKKGVMFVDVRFDALAEPAREALLPRGKLNEGALKSFNWDIQQSGTQIPDAVAAELEKAWYPNAFPEDAARIKAEEEHKLQEEQQARAAAAQQAATEAAEKKTRAEAEHKVREKAEQRVREEAERRSREEAERVARAEAEHKAQAAAEQKKTARKLRPTDTQPLQAIPAANAAPTAASATAVSGPWSIREAQAVTEDYFTMLHAEITGKLYSKADHRNRLSTELRRDGDEVESYYCGISAILGAIGLPFIDTFKPETCNDAQLETAIQELITQQPERIESLWIADEPARTSIPVELDDSKAFWVSAPTKGGAGDYAAIAWNPGGQVEADFRKREARNYNLATAGERFVLAFERARLREAGRKELIERIEWTSQHAGADMGYDIKSFNDDGSERIIAVKTTNYNQRFPFAISAEELAYSQSNSKNFHIYRVFNFSKGARLFILTGNLEKSGALKPVVYRVVM